MSMQGRTNTAATPRQRAAHAVSMSGRQRRRELIEIIATGLERAVAERTSQSGGDVSFSDDSGVYGLELSTTSRLSVRAGREPDRNESKAGERT
jgi:hypothetical protein